MDSNFQFRDASPPPRAWAPSFGSERWPLKPPQGLCRLPRPTTVRMILPDGRSALTRTRPRSRCLSHDCGRDTHYWAPPAQIRTCSFPAYGSHLGCLTAGLAAFRTRSGTCDTLSRHCVRHVWHRFAFSLASALRSTASAAGRPALFGGFVTTTAESDFSCPCIIGFGSSPSDAGQSAVQPVAGHETSQVPTRSFRT